jgi:DUF1680 family protein
MIIGRVRIRLSLRTRPEPTSSLDRSLTPMSDPFPFFSSTPVPPMSVRLTGGFWGTRQDVVRTVTVPYIAEQMLSPGGTSTTEQVPVAGGFEAIKFVEAMATTLALAPDAQLAQRLTSWSHAIASTVGEDGYLGYAHPALSANPSERWVPEWHSHEDYALGHFVEAALAIHEVTGDPIPLDAARRAVEEFATATMDRDLPYTPGHAEIEQALTRLWASTGDKRALELCGWLISRRGRTDGRTSLGPYAQDHAPLEEQDAMAGHAVRAAFLFNGATEYVGATGDAGYRDAVVRLFDDLVSNRLYLHGGSGSISADNEGYRLDLAPPQLDDCYGESCAVIGGIRWAHSIARLTGRADVLDIAERMLYNAFAASLSLDGDRFFYRNVAQQDEATGRFSWHPCPCCPPNIVKLITTVGGLLYSSDAEGLVINHFAASEAVVPVAGGTRVVQRTDYPWEGSIVVELHPPRASEFTVRVRIPGWSRGATVTVAGEPTDEPVVEPVVDGWIRVRRTWKPGDELRLDLPLTTERCAPESSPDGAAGLTAIRRGPIVFCLEEQDVAAHVWRTVLPPDSELRTAAAAELGGATVVRTELSVDSADGAQLVPATFVPYALWANRRPGAMRIWVRDGSPQTHHRRPEPPEG